MQQQPKSNHQITQVKKKNLNSDLKNRGTHTLSDQSHADDLVAKGPMHKKSTNNRKPLGRTQITPKTKMSSTQ